MDFSRPEYWSGQPFPSPGDLPNAGIKSRSPALQADSLPAEPQGKASQSLPYPRMGEAALGMGEMVALGPPSGHGPS